MNLRWKRVIKKDRTGMWCWLDSWSNSVRYAQEGFNPNLNAYEAMK